ncbi:MAG: hypothetical protein WKF51_11830 [Geodermatophilaceae bacterium]
MSAQRTPVPSEAPLRLDRFAWVEFDTARERWAVRRRAFLDRLAEQLG